MKAPVFSTHDPERLFAASQERMATVVSVNGEGRDLVAAAYLAGLAVEVILQALAHLDGAEHDARHRLDLWLGKCSPVLQSTLTQPRVREAWSFLDAIWRNELRYYSREEWIGLARRNGRWWRLKGDDDAKIRRCTSDLIAAADRVHKKGLAEWRRKKS